ncbi:MAG: hypothetical protein V3S31_01215 [Dehalococcoidia bacterium]
MRDPGICAVTFNTPERLNGFTPEIKRDLVGVLGEPHLPRHA